MFSRHLRSTARTVAPLISVVTLAAVNENQSHCGFFDSFFGPNIDSVKKDICDLIDKEEEKRGDGTSPAPTFIRLAWL